MAQVQLTVPTMTCGHCKQTVTRTLTSLAGVHRVTVDLALKQVQVEYDVALVTLEQMTAALAEENYPVTAVNTIDATATVRQVDEAGAACSCCQPQPLRSGIQIPPR